MFGKKKQSNSKAKTKVFSTTLISHTTIVVGDIQFSGDLEIQGTIRGNVIAVPGEPNAAVKVVKGGRVEGDIKAPKVMINGTVEGDVYSSDFVELAEKARIKGNVNYHLFEMVKGAEVNGSLLHKAKESRTEQKQAPAKQKTVDADSKPA